MCDKVKSFDEIGKFNCNTRLQYIQFLETQLAKSITEPVLENAIIKKKKEENEKCLQKKIDTYKAEFKASGCGTKPELESCVTLKQYITSLQDTNVNVNSSLSPDLLNSLKQQYKNEFLKNKCDKVFSDYALGQVSEVSEKYKGIDKERIETASKKIRNQRIYFGASILLVGLVSIIMFSKKK
jgi:hypothetical protein